MNVCGRSGAGGEQHGGEESAGAPQVRQHLAGPRDGGPPLHVVAAPGLPSPLRTRGQAREVPLALRIRAAGEGSPLIPRARELGRRTLIGGFAVAVVLR